MAASDSTIVIFMEYFEIFRAEIILRPIQAPGCS